MTKVQLFPKTPLRFPFTLGFVLAFVAAIAGCKTTRQPTQGGLVIYFQSNRYGNLETCGCHTNPYGGIDREANAISASNRALNLPVLMLDSGNLLVPRERALPIDHYQKRAERILPLFSELGLDVFAPGPEDLQLGVSHLERIASKSRFAWVSTNVRNRNGNPVFPASVAIEKGGIGITILSLTPPHNPSSEWKLLDPITSLELELKKVKPDTFVVVLSQLGNVEDIRIAERFPRIQLVVGADPILATERPQWFEGHTLIVDADLNGYLLGKLVLNLKLPFKGLYSPVDLETNQALLKEYQERAAQTGEKRFKDYAKRFESTRQVSIPDGASHYDFELIKLDETRFGQPSNQFTTYIREVKEWTRSEAVKR